MDWMTTGDYILAGVAISANLLCLVLWASKVGIR